MTLCVCGCGDVAVQRHHVVYEQEIRRRKGDPTEPHWIVAVGLDCHARHHSRSKPLSLAVIPDWTYEAAFELMGPAAYDYLRRRYDGEDARLDALLLRDAA